MRLNSKKLTRRNSRQYIERFAMVSLLTALSFAYIESSALAQTAPSIDTTGSATTSDSVSADALKRARLRKAVMRARQQADGPEGMEPGGEPFTRAQLPPPGGDGPGSMETRRGRWMQGGPNGAGHPFKGRGGQFGGRGRFAGAKRALDLTPLNLTEEQKSKIQQLRVEKAGRARELKRKLMADRQELKDLMFDPAASDDTIRSKMRDIRKSQNEAEEMRVNDFLSIRNILTPEQRKRLPEVKPGGPRAAMIGRRGDGPGPDGPPMPPPNE